MGEVSRRRRITARKLEAHPFCCFCGGRTPATTIDHVPARIMFPDRRRPAGLEVPACVPCNEGTRRHETIAAVFSRISVFDDPPLVNQTEFARICRAARNASPAWAAEMAAGTAQPVDRTRLRELSGHSADQVRAFAVGPLSQDCMEIIGAKLAFAIHYDKTGRSVPSTGGVEVHFKTNLQFLEQRPPEEILRELGPMETLRQGQWHVGDFFNFRGAWIPDGSAGLYLCLIGVAFMTTAFVFSDLSAWPDDPGRGRRFRPGDLRAKATERRSPPAAAW